MMFIMCANVGRNYRVQVLNSKTEEKDIQGHSTKSGKKNL